MTTALLESYAALYGRDMSVLDIWQEGKPTFARMLGKIWMELDPIGTRRLAFSANGGRNICEFPTSASEMWRTITRERLIQEWSRHTLLRRVVRRNMEAIEAKLWALPDGPMVQRLWREILM